MSLEIISEKDRTLFRTEENQDRMSIQSERSSLSCSSVQPNVSHHPSPLPIFLISSLIQLQGLTILTDPVFQLQPIKSIFSPKRLRPMPCGIAEILSGRIDIVLLSHNHFDHLDLTILKSFPKTVKWFVPLGVAKVLKSNGLKKEIEVKEMDWWEEIGLELKIPVRVGCGSESERLEEGRSQEKEERIKMKDLKIQIMALPALHWTGRMTPLDTNTTLWCSYSLKVVEDEPKSLVSFL